MNKSLPTIAVLGASGLIGEIVASRLARKGFPIVPIARRLSRAQKAEFETVAVECSFISFDAVALAHIFSKNKVDIVVNCVGVLQDGPRGKTDDVHRAFVERLLTALGSQEGPLLLIHLSIPGDSRDDRTRFSQTKRAAER